MLTAEELRTKFIAFFSSRNHTPIDSSSVVPHNDTTLLFVNSGMVQFKDNILNTPTKRPLTRCCSVQRCIRAGGKHNDLNDVGKDTYHHTFFEMLGNWSFGDYFKEEAIAMAFEFLVSIGLDKNNLYVSYLDDENCGIAADLESKEIWKKYVPESRIVKGSFKDNFWEMGDTGPCGPCSEIHYDRVGGRDASFLVNHDDPDVIEIWNLVFMQYNRTDKLYRLEIPCVDTGAGFERILSICNGVRSNYATDLFVPLFNFTVAAAIKSNEKVENKKLNKSNINETELEDLNFNDDLGFKQNLNAKQNLNLTDNKELNTKHIKEIEDLNLAGDKKAELLKMQLKASELKKIQLKDIKEIELQDLNLTGHKKAEINAKNELLNNIVDFNSVSLLDNNKKRLISYLEKNKKIDANRIEVALRVLSDHSRTIAVCLHDKVHFSNEGRGYVLRRITRRAIRFAYDVLNLENGFISKLVQRAAAILSLKGVDYVAIDEEEKLFNKALQRGVLLFNKIVDKTGTVTAKDAFDLYATYGFPFDLTKILAEEKNIKIEESEFLEEVSRNKSSAKKNKYDFVLPNVAIRTDDSFKYSTNGIRSRLVYNDRECFIFDRTCFYYEMGGQVSDLGTVLFASNEEEENDENFVQFNENGILLKRGGVETQIEIKFDENRIDKLTLDENRIDGLKLNGVLNVKDVQCINGYVVHLGELVGNANGVAIMIYDEKRRECIKKNHTATHLMNGFLKQKYGSEQRGSLVEPDKLRFDFSGDSISVESIEENVNKIIKSNLKVVVYNLKKEEVGEDVIKLKEEKYPDVVRVVGVAENKELCGGTHVNETGEIGRFRILSEQSIGKGTRRIVAVTGDFALKAEKSENVAELPYLERRLKEKELLMETKKINNEKNKLILDESRRAEEKVKEGVKVFLTKMHFEYNENEKKKHLLKIYGVFRKYEVQGFVYEEELRFVCDPCFKDVINTDYNEFNGVLTGRMQSLDFMHLVYKF